MNLTDKFLKSEEKTGDPFILYRKAASGPFSFFDQKKPFNEKMPPPVYLSQDDLNFEKSFSEQENFQSFKKEKNGDLKLTDEEVKERQSGIIVEMVQKVGTQLLSGKNIMGLSLPVRIFEPRSTIERIADAFHYFPHYMKKAVESKDSVERIKLILSAVIGVQSQSLS